MLFSSTLCSPNLKLSGWFQTTQRDGVKAWRILHLMQISIKYGPEKATNAVSSSTERKKFTLNSSWANPHGNGAGNWAPAALLTPNCLWNKCEKNNSSKEWADNTRTKGRPRTWTASLGNREKPGHTKRQIPNLHPHITEQNLQAAPSGLLPRAWLDQEMLQQLRNYTANHFDV